MATPPRLLTGNAVPITNDGVVPMSGDLAMALHRIQRLGAPVDPTDAARLMDAGGGGGSGGLTFADYGTQDTSAGRYTSWTDLMAALAAMQIGSAPIITVSLTTGPFAVPLAGMPVRVFPLTPV